jgi:hypothetical protein
LAACTAPFLATDQNPPPSPWVYMQILMSELPPLASLSLSSLSLS